MKKVNEVAMIIAGTAYVLEALGQEDKVKEMFDTEGLTLEETDALLNYLAEELDDEEYANYLAERLTDSMRQLKKYYQVAKGYTDMGDLNAKISSEDSHLEDEGANLGYEMVEEEREDKAE